MLASRIVLRTPFVTVDGCSAPPPGITITSGVVDDGLLEIGGTHDIVLQNLRLRGLWSPGSNDREGTPNLVVDGDSPPDHVAARLVFDHLTSTKGNDSALDVWGEVQDVTVSWCLLHENNRGGIVSHYPAPHVGADLRVALHVLRVDVVMVREPLSYAIRSTS